MDQDSARRLAEQLAAARQGSAPLVEPPSIADISTAYAIQSAATAALGQRLGGWKIGATATATQVALATDGPFFGPIPSIDCHESGAEVLLPPGTRGIECEIAFRLGADLPRRRDPYTMPEILAAVASAYPAIELVVTRWRTGTAMEARLAIADFGLNGTLVLGPAIADWQNHDLAAAPASLRSGDGVVATGTGEVVMGGPLLALQWLADHGPGLEAGQVVSTGTFTGLSAIVPGQTATADFGPLGAVSIRGHVA